MVLIYSTKAEGNFQLIIHKFKASFYPPTRKTMVLSVDECEKDNP